MHLPFVLLVGVLLELECGVFDVEVTGHAGTQLIQTALVAASTAAGRPRCACDADAIPWPWFWPISGGELLG